MTSSLERGFRLAARICSGIVTALGAFVLVGWAFDIPVLKSIHPSLATMKANSATLFVLLGVTIWLTADHRDRRLRSALGLIVATVAALTLFEYAFGTNLGLDELLHRDPGIAVGTAAPGRMAGATALAFLLLGLAALPAEGVGRGRLRRMCAWFGGAIGLWSLAGYLYDVGSLYAVAPFGSIALHTTIGLLFASGALLLTDTREGSLFGMLASKTVTGTLLRWLLPMLVTIPLATGWLRLTGQRWGYYDTNFGIAILVLTTIGSLVIVTWLVSRSLYWSERAQRANQDALLNTQHELSMALRAAQENDARHRAVVDAALDAIVTMDDTGAIVDFNPAAERMFGHQRADVLDKPLADIILPPTLRDAHRRGLAHHHLEGSHSAMVGKIVESTALRSDGSEFPVELATARIPGQTRPQFVGFIRDITDRRRGLERFRLAIEAAPTAAIMTDDTGRIVLVNALVEQQFGYSRADLIGQPIEILIPMRFRTGHPGLCDSFFANPRARSMGVGRDLYGLRRDGTEMPVEIGLNPVETAEGRYVLNSIVDITERRRADDERARLVDELQALTKDLEQRVESGTRDVRANEARYRALFDDSPIALWEEDFTETIAFLRDVQSSGPGDIRDYLTTHPDAVATAIGKVKVLAVNRRCLEMFRAASAGDLVEALPLTFGPGAPEVFRDKLAAFLEGRTSFEAETVRLTVTGRPMNISLRSSVLPGHQAWSRVVDSMVDVTATREVERKLQESFRQQEVLLKEIHHRVKNNLAVISSLFYLASCYSKDEHTVRVFEDCQRRVRSMALVHETLYGSQDLAAVDFAEYARILTGELLATYGSRGGHVQLKTDLHPVMMTIETAVPCGLILGELVSNAFKHAFPNGRRGTIRVEIRPPRDGLIVLRVVDDGVGLPPDLDLGTEHSMGMRLIQSLVHQIRGSLEWARSPGADARLTFRSEDEHVH